MNKTGWIILAGTFVVVFGGAAGLLAVAIYTWTDVSPESTPRSLQSGPETVAGDEPGAEPIGVVPEPEPTPSLRGVGTLTDANLARRLGALELEVKSLREQLAAERKWMKPLLDVYDRAKESGMLTEDGTPIEAGGLELLDDPLMAGTPAAARKLARELGLDSGRTKAFTKSYEDFLAKVKDLEEEHASVKRDGDTTTITITPFGQAGDQVRREWDDFVDGSLSADEKQGYDKQGVRNRLINSRGGTATRTIRIVEAGGAIQIADESDDGKGGKIMQTMQGPAAARDMMLEDYAHLLK